MDYEKKYKEVLKKVEMLRGYSLECNNMIDKLFYELKESEDEKIRKELIGMVKFHCADEHLGRYLNWLEKQGEQKPVWSEKDEERIKQICEDLKCGLENFRSGKSVKGLHFEEIINSNIDWLKSLKPQQRWKPTEEQMENLEYAINMVDKCCEDSLQSLYNDLKKL